MSISRGALIAIFAAIPADVAAQCAATLNPCEIALYESATILDAKQKKTNIKLTTCLAKLEARSSSVTAARVVPEIIEAKPEDPTSWPAWIAASAGMGLLVGIILGLMG